MKVFISWSKEPSKTVAEALRDWLPDVLQQVEPWVSSADIGAGARWNHQIAEQLAQTKAGILCVTTDNQREPWLLFEAGALAKSLQGTVVCPYLIGMTEADLEQGPLTQFQSKRADPTGTFELVTTINSALSAPLAPDRLQRLFERNWPALRDKLKNLPTQATPGTVRGEREMLTEILQTVRGLARREWAAEFTDAAWLFDSIAHERANLATELLTNIQQILPVPSEMTRTLHARLMRMSLLGLRTLQKNLQTHDRAKRETAALEFLQLVENASSPAEPSPR